VPAARQPPSAARHSTARVATTAGVRRSELPGWFWTALGCLSVLVVGLTVVFLMGQTGAATTAAVPAVVPGSVSPPADATPGKAAPPAPDPQRARAGAMQIEKMVAPPPAIDQIPAPAPQPKPKAVRPVKVARSPGAAKPVAARPAAAEADDEADEPRAKPAPRAAAADDEAEEK
jgi:hypothetical protein